MKKLLALLTAILLCLSATAFAGIYTDGDGYTQEGLTTMKLSMRSGPGTDYTDLGTYKVSGQWVDLIGRYWDEDNGIWWLYCSFTYGNEAVCGWTGAKRFDLSTFELYDLPEYYDDGEAYRANDDCCDDDYDCTACTARTIMKLSMRSGPSNKTEDIGSYDIAGEWVEVYAKHWDKTNSIWWINCGFEYKGKWVTGWTGAKRFDSNSYDIDDLPIE